MDINSKVKLNNGVEMPLLGLGVYLSEEGSETENAVVWALEAGYRHIDTAAVYGNEKSVGTGIKKSGVPREDVFITTKLWNGDMRRGRVREAFEESLRRLGTDFIDLYLLHWPVPGRFADSYLKIARLYEEGRIRAIGVSNFNEHHIDELLRETDIVPAVNQIECHPYLTQNPLIGYCREKGIAAEAWSPLGGSGARLLRDPLIEKLAQKYGRTPAQVILRFDIQKNIIVIPKSVRRERIISNSRIFDFELCAEDCAAIEGLNKNRRFGPDPDNFGF